jgi:RNA 3'-terminal phosphate cyclase (ATP)
MLIIDGSMGEGGGQILRSSLSLSMCLNKPFRIVNIRSTRRRPGLRHQHLMAVKAAAQIAGAFVEGATLGSTALSFVPRKILPGHHHFDIGTAGSTTLVLQTVLPALMTADTSSQLTLIGGTHNPLAPPFDFLSGAYLPLINRMGPHVAMILDRPGFFPAGGGYLRVRIDPAPQLNPVLLLERGNILEIYSEAWLSKLPSHIAQRELKVVGTHLDIGQEQLKVRTVTSAHGPGNILLVVVRAEHITEVFAGFGERGIRAETVAKRVVKSVRRYLAAGVPVGEYLADQLLVPIALAGGGSFLTLRPSLHTKTNTSVIKKFMNLQITFSNIAPDIWRITVK